MELKPAFKSKMRGLGVLPVSLLLACAAAVPPAAAQVSLTTVVELAQSNSSAVKLAEADLLKAQGALAQTQDAYIPNLVVASTVGYSHGFPTGQPSVGSATMQSLLFSYSQRQYSKAAKAGVDAANLNLKDAREQAALDASTAYIEFDTVSRELVAAKQQETYTDDLLGIAQKREQAGVDSHLESLEAQLKVAELRLERMHLETRAETLAKQLTVLTGLPVGSVLADHASIPEIPKVSGDEIAVSVPGTNSADALARSKAFQAKGDDLAWRRPQIGFGAVYNYDSNELNNYSLYYRNFTPNNVSFGAEITLPFFDFALRAKARQSAADALRATVEAEQAKRQNDVQITTLTGTLRELDAQAEVASLKQQIADAQLKAVLVEMESGNGASAGPGAQPQVTPKAEQLARIDERQKYVDAQEAALALAKARLELLRALGHMGDWLAELKGK